MKKIILCCVVLLSQSSYAINNELMEKLLPIQKQWAVVKYKMEDEKKADAYQDLSKQAQLLVNQYPDEAEPLIWQAINISSYAGAIGGLKSLTRALPAVKQARDLLHQAEQINPSAMDGSVYTSLGALYYQVPGWPIGFGDKKQARYYLEKAMTTYPNKLDSGYFYGDYLIQQHEYDKAREVLLKALTAPQLSNRPLADQGRRNEIKALLENEKLKTS